MSNFRLYPVPQSKLECLKDIIAARIVESNLQERSDASECLDKLNDGYDARTMAAYVDSIADPKCCLIMAHFPGLATSGTVAFISLIYTCPERRGDAEVLSALLTTAENYAKLQGAEILAVTSWLYRGSKGTDDVWKRNSFEIQESTYVKHLT